MPALLAAVSLAGTAAAQEQWLPLDTREAYAAAVAARQVTLRDGSVRFVAEPGGSFEGESEGAGWRGSWTIRKGMVCFEGHREGDGPTYGCARAFLSGDVLKLEFPLGMGTLLYDLGPRP